MSQQKVDRYKQEKAHRKERLEKEKKRKKLLRICSYFVLAVIVLAIAFAIYRHYTPKTETPAETETTVESVIETTTAEESTVEEGTVEESTAVETEDTDTESTSEETADIESAAEKTDAAGTERCCFFMKRTQKVSRLRRSIKRNRSFIFIIPTRPG